MAEIRFAFRMVHIDNIDHIVKYGFVHKDSPYASPNYVPIGDVTVIGSRVERQYAGVSLSDCIPFYFGPRSPMLYVIQHGFNGVKQYNAQDIVYCAIALKDIVVSDIDCFFSDGHALNRMTKFYPKSELGRINDIVRYEDVYTKYWQGNGPFDDTKRKKEAELLVKDEIPPEYIRGFVVYNTYAKKQLIDKGVSEDKIVEKKEFYY